MTKGFEKIERIQYLMEELQKELESLPAYEKELNANLSELDRETSDILHIIESIELSSVESTKLIARTHELRKERRESKAVLHQVAPIKNATLNLKNMLAHKIKEVSNCRKHNVPGDTYMFRTQKGFELMETVIGDFESRSRVNITAPNAYVKSKVAIPVPAIKETVVSVVPTANTAPIIQPIVIPESTKNYLLISACGKWQLKAGSSVVLNVENLVTIVDFLYENGWKTIKSTGQSKPKVKHELRELKKLETEITKIQRYAKLQQLLY
jgi:hypothetical protein